MSRALEMKFIDMMSPENRALVNEYGLGEFNEAHQMAQMTGQSVKKLLEQMRAERQAQLLKRIG